MNIEELILGRMQRLMCLSLPRQPAAELIEGTAHVWLERLSGYSPERLEIAFNAIESLALEWPSPALIISCLPTYAPPRSTVVPAERQIAPDPEAEAARTARIRAMIAACAAKLGMPA